MTLVLVLAVIAQAAVPAQGASVQERLDRVRADLFSRTDRVDEDVKELKQILAIEPRSAEAHALLGIAYRASGSPDLIGEAVAEFREALTLDPSMVAVRLYLAHVYLDLGRGARAREELETGLSQTPGSPEFLALLGETERQLKNPQHAVELLRHALQTDESNSQTRYYLGLALYDLGQRDDAIKELEGVVQSAPGVADPYLALGTMYLEAGRVPDARQTFERGVRVDPSVPELHIQLARAYRLSGSLQKADTQLALATSRAEAAPAASDYQRRRIEFDLYLERGLLKLKQGQLGAAAEAFKKVLEIDPNNEPATRALAEIRRRQSGGAKKKSGGGL
jgi:Tfp pilus assembly protein PilF